MAANGNPPGLFFAITFLVSFGALLGPSPVYGQACGDVIRTDTVLTADIGPCPGDGLVIFGPLDGITLNLNGFTISGSGAGRGVIIASSGVTILGPGTITDFGVGIFEHGVRNSTIQDLALASNQFGIALSQVNPITRVIKNTIDGGAHGVTGIALSEVLRAKIKGNVITGHSGAGIQIGLQSQSEIVLNSVTGNGTGLIYREFEPSPITIRDNEFSNNTQDGVSIFRLQNLTLDFNTITGNGGNGVSVISAFGRAQGTNLIGDNVVDHNGGQGIALANIFVRSGSVQIIDNEVLGNAAVDLFWDGTGGNICWKFNTFGTSDPPTLPSCP